jgi:hypothetical protein
MNTIWERAYRAGLTDYGPLPVRLEVFEFRARDLLARRLARLGRGAGELSLAALFARTAGPDLVLASAVEHDDPGARKLLETRFLPRLVALLKARDPGASPEQMEAIVRAALAEWSAPVLHGATATRIGTFDATGSLETWLSVMLLLHGQPPPLDCPDPNLLAGHLEGRLESREKSSVDAHLNGCLTCLGVFNRLRAVGVAPVANLPPELPLPERREPVLVEPMPGPSHLPPPHGGVSWKAWTAIVVIVGGILVASLSAGGRTLFDTDARRQDTEHEVFAAAQQLVGTQPGFFAHFSAYTSKELETEQAPEERRGFAAMYPREKVLERTPKFVWSGAPGAARYHVTLRGEDGHEAFRRTVTGQSLDWPDDVPAPNRESVWTWEVAPEGSAAPPAQAKYHVASEREAVRWDKQKERIGRVAQDVGTRAVLTAQIALKTGHLWEAYTLVREHVARYPKDAYGRALLENLERVHGLHL